MKGKSSSELLQKYLNKLRKREVLMKRLILILLSLVTALLYQSCDRARYHVFKSYVTRYCKFEDIGIDTTKAGNIIIRGSREIGRASCRERV